MSDDFDDDVFDDINVTDLDTLQSSQPHNELTQPGRGRSQKRKSSAGEQFDDDVFDDIDGNDMLQGDPNSNSRGDGTELPTKRARIDYDSSSNAVAADGDEDLALARRLLKEKFGYSSFRHEQEGAIGRILSGKNSLVIFPTGAGKSLCYQVSASSASPKP